MATVELRDLAKSYGAAAAVDRVSLRVPSGAFVTLLGPSGCGKTTTLRAIAGLVEPDSGAILLDGEDVTRVPIHRRDIGMVFQSHALFPHMAVAANVGFGLRMRGIAGADREARVREALALVRLEAFGDRLPARLSGGQQQRVALARALVIRPRVLLLDEPFGALDRKLREAMQQELRELVRRLGATAIFVTHDQEEAMILSDAVAVMNAGRIEQVDAPAGVFERPRTRFVADFMGMGNVLAVEAGPGGALRHGGIALRADAVADTAAPPRHVAIRAERVALRPATGAPPEPNAAEGTLLDAVYHGSLTTGRVRLDAAPSTTMLVREASATQDAAGWRVGARVRLSWTASAVRMLED
ncbi:MAG: ABC transporter ATP-binding protein [Alphaproteobacteria bacterium]